MSVERRVLILLLGAFVLVNGAYDLGRAVFGPKRGEDFATYYVVGRAVRSGQGRHIYDQAELQRLSRAYGVHGIPTQEGGLAEAGAKATQPVPAFLYPPPAAMLLSPISLLPYNAALAVFFVISVAAQVLAIWLFFSNRPPNIRRLAVALGLAAMVVFFPSTYSLYMGQVNGLVFLCCLAALWAIRRDHQVAGGVLVGVATVVKLFPGILILPLVLHRKFRSIVAVIGTTIALSALSLPIGGTKLWHTYMSTVFKYNFKADPWVRNQGTSGALARLLIHNPYVRSIGNHPAIAHGVADVSNLAVSSAVIFIVWRAVRGRSGDSLLLELSWATFLALAIFIVSNSWETYAIFLLPSFFLLTEQLARIGGASGKRDPRIEVMWAGGAVSFCIWSFVLKTGQEYAALPTSAIANPLYSLKAAATFLVLVLDLALIRSVTRRSVPALNSADQKRPSVAGPAP